MRWSLSTPRIHLKTYCFEVSEKRIFPAIDIRDKKVVRLTFGDYDQMKIYADDHAQIAKNFKECGATNLHVVDLDGAKDGAPVNFDAIKEAGMKKFVGVDAGFNTLIRPAMYDSYHYVAVANKFNKAGVAKYEVVGPICESGDYIAHDRALPEMEEGDIVAVYCGGAYGFSMSSNYNSRPRCAEVLVNNGEAELIREREDFEDLWRHQIVPARLSK